MYGAMREHAPSSTRLAGLASATAMTLAMGFALANGMGNYIAANLPDPIIYVPLPDAPPSEPPPLTSDPLDVSSDASLLAVDPVVLLDRFEVDNPPMTGTLDPPPRKPAATSNTATPTPPKPPVRTSAIMLPAASPAYPVSEVRKGNQGISSLDLCLDARGRVTSAALISSSGHPALDNAALKWVRDRKFTPAKVDGAPQAICGHAVSYEWKLDKR